MSFIQKNFALTLDIFGIFEKMASFVYFLRGERRFDKRLELVVKYNKNKRRRRRR